MLLGAEDLTKQQEEGIVADQSSFDVVSEVNMQEMKNVVDQAMKEIKQRFDFKDSKTELTLKEKEKELVVLSDDEYKLNAVIEIIKTKCVKRGVSLKAFEYGKIEEALGATVRQVIKIQSGISSEKAKEITKAVKESKIKVQAQIQGEQVRVISKSKDDLQTAIAYLKRKDFGIDLQFTNYRSGTMLKRAPTCVLGRSSTSTCRHEHASADDLPCGLVGWPV